MLPLPIQSNANNYYSKFVVFGCCQYTSTPCFAPYQGICDLEFFDIIIIFSHWSGHINIMTKIVVILLQRQTTWVNNPM